MFNKLRQRSKGLVKELVKCVRPKFEEFVSSTEPAIVIMISVVAVVYATAVIIFLASLAFGFQDMVIREVWPILIAPLLPFATIVCLSAMEWLWIAMFTRVMPRFIKYIDDSVERIKNREKHKQSRFERTAKKFDDETLDLIVNKSQILSISIWLQFAACVMSGLIAMNTHRDGDFKKTLLRCLLPIVVELIGLVLFFIHGYFNNVITVKKRLKKLDD